jgi:hypothetical protein
MQRTFLIPLISGLFASLLSFDTAISQESKPRLRVGVYDNRAIAVAYAPSKYNLVQDKMKQYEEAKKAGDSARAKELQDWGAKHERQLHRQGFGRVPVDDLLAHVKDRLPEIARKATLVKRFAIA